MKQLVLNLATRQRRAALIENGKVVEIFIERALEERIVGNVYVGKVMNVLPGMQAAFVDIGLSKNGFLYRDDVVAYQAARKNDPEAEKENISSFLTIGQEVTVQVTKESFGTKGPRLTEVIAFPGTYVVYLPNGNYIGISRKLTDERERQRLKMISESFLQEDEGLIVRTAAERIEPDVLKEEIERLREFWMKIESERIGKKRPYLLYQETDLIGKFVRDRTFEQCSEIVLDDPESFVYLRNLFADNKKLVEKIKLYQEKEEIFSRYHIEKELEKALQRQVWLKNGGYLLIEQTEALTVIDVNTGKFIGKQGLQETVLKTNEAAAKEIARQLRLRDLSGIIMIDFIHMKNKEDQDALLHTLKEALKSDRTKTNVIGMTPLGLVEMTRKKIYQNLNDSLTNDCPNCAGTGKVISAETAAFKLERQLWEYRRSDYEAVVVVMRADVKAVFCGADNLHLQQLEEMLKMTIFIVVKEAEQPFTLSYIGSLKEAEQRYASLKSNS